VLFFNLNIFAYETGSDAAEEGIINEIPAAGKLEIRDANWEEHWSDFSKYAKSINMCLVPTQGDGDCLFRSISTGRKGWQPREAQANRR
jgi:hypothetical protein